MARTDVSALLLLVAKKDKRAFGRLYAATSAKIFGVLLRMLNNRSDAEDGLQEVFIKIWVKADRYAVSQYSPISWLVAIARNHAIDVLRRPRQKSESLDDCGEVADERENPEATAIQADFTKRASLRIQDLAPLKAALVHGAYVEGQTYAQLAFSHKMPINTVRTWLYRGLREMASSEIDITAARAA